MKERYLHLCLSPHICHTSVMSSFSAGALSENSSDSCILDAIPQLEIVGSTFSANALCDIKTTT